MKLIQMLTKVTYFFHFILPKHRYLISLTLLKVDVRVEDVLLNQQNVAKRLQKGERYSKDEIDAKYNQIVASRALKILFF
jgi:hypothetical protein